MENHNENPQKQQTPYLEALTSIVDSSKRYTRKEDHKLLKLIDSEHIAQKFALKLIYLSTEHQKLTSFAGSLGRSVSDGVLDLEELSDDKNRTEIELGLYLLRLMERKGELLIYFRDADDIFEDPSYYVIWNTKTVIENRYARRNGQAVTYQIEIQTNEFLDGLTGELGYFVNRTYELPLYDKPAPRKSLVEPGRPRLVKNIGEQASKLMTIEHTPLSFTALDQQVSISKVVNIDLLHIIEQVQDHPYFNYSYTGPNKMYELAPDAIVGRSREKNLVLSIAKSVGDNVFYEDHYYDSRGRLYPSCVFFNHQGSKLSKSLIKHANGAPLQASGWDMLMMHMANCAGHDKLPIQERIQWTEDNLDAILDIIENDPAKDFRWIDGIVVGEPIDDPCGALATMLEISNAVNSGDEYSYVSSLMVGLDATSSAYQIIGSCTGDELLLRLSNLTDSDVVGDTYKYIGQDAIRKIKRRRDVEARFWLKLEQSFRSLAKRSVMTYPYSAKEMTMGEHIFKDHREKAVAGSLYEGINEDNCAALGTILYNSCRKKLPMATGWMELIIYVAKRQAAVNQHYGFLGYYNKFPFFQNYNEYSKDFIKFWHRGRQVRLRYKHYDGSSIDLQKISNASPANSTHNIDGQLVTKVNIELDYEVTTTHDCFSTIPVHAGQLYEDLRQFHDDLYTPELLIDMIEQNNCSDLIDDHGLISWTKTSEFMGITTITPMTLQIQKLRSQAINNQYCYS